MLIKIKDKQGREVVFATMYSVTEYTEGASEKVFECEEWILLGGTLNWLPSETPQTSKPKKSKKK